MVQASGWQRAGHLLRGLAGLAGLLTVLVGAPTVLLVSMPNPIPHHVPSWEHLRDLLVREDDGTLFLAVIGTVAWVVWALLVASILLELVAVLRRRPTPRLRGFGFPQGLAATLVAASLLLTTHAAPATPPTATPVDSGPAKAPPAATAVSAGSSASTAPTAPAARFVAATATGTADTTTAPAAAARTYTVADGDTLSGVAARFLGDPDAWARLAALNHRADPDLLHPGERLLLPSWADDEGGPRDGARGRVDLANGTYVVAAGDRLADIAYRVLGNPGRYRDLARQSGITDPDLIRPGQAIVLPADAHDRGPQDHAHGQVTTTPRTAPSPRPAPSTPPPAPRAPTRPAPAPPSQPPPSRPAPSRAPGWPSRTPAASPPEQPGPSSTDRAAPIPPPASGSSRAVPSTPPATTSTPRPPSTASPQPAPAPPTGPSASDPQSPPDTIVPAAPGDGVSLPGGWVPIGLAAAIAAAGVWVWRRRRRRYDPTRPVPADQDPDLAPLPPTVSRLRAATRNTDPSLLDEPDPGPTVADTAHHRAANTPMPPLPGPGPDGPELAELTARGTPLPPGGVGLTGPGAADAARSLLLATLAAGGPRDPDAAGIVLIPATTLTDLLGAAAVDLGTLPRLRVTATATAAITAVEELLIERRRILDDHDAPDLAALRAIVGAPPMPPVLLIADTPPAGLGPRVIAALRLGAPLQISAVFLGAGPDDATVHIDADGTTIAPDGLPVPGRVAILDTAAVLPLLGVLREAHTGHPPTDNLSPPPPPHPLTSPAESAEPADASTDDADPTPNTTTTVDSAVDRAVDGLSALEDDNGVTSDHGNAGEVIIDEPSPVPPGPAPHPNPPETEAAPTVPEPAPPRPVAAETELAFAEPRPGDPEPDRPHRSRAEAPPGREAADQPVDPTPEVAGPADRRAMVHVLGRYPEVRPPDGRAPGAKLRGGAAHLLAYLAYHPRGNRLSELMEVLYPDATVKSAAARLSTESGHLRTAIRRAIGVTDKSTDPMPNTGSHYHLDPQHVRVDWWTLRDALAEAATSTDRGHKIDALRRAVAAYTGPIAGATVWNDPDWLEPAREHTRRQGIAALTQLAVLTGDDDPHEAVALLERAHTEDPVNEEITRLAIRARARLGDAEAIRDLLRSLTTALEDIDAEPDPATTELAAALLRDLPETAGPRRGRHRHPADRDTGTDAG